METRRQECGEGLSDHGFQCVKEALEQIVVGSQSIRRRRSETGQRSLCG